MNQDIKDKLRKVYELVNRGATEGEKAAARKAIDRILKKHNLTEEALNGIDRNEYRFKYSTELEKWLLCELVSFFLGEEEVGNCQIDNWSKREVVVNFNYFDYITIEASYEYFRRHMKSEWNRVCAPVVAKCRKAKTKNKRRTELQNLFFSKYCIASKIVKEYRLLTVDLSNASQKEIEDRMKLQQIEGGHYSKQVTNGLYLEEGKRTNANEQLHFNL